MAATGPGTEFLPDSVEQDKADEYVASARLILNAALYPNELPDDPLPAPLEVALAAVTYEVWQLDVAGGESGRRVVSESLGSYSYRLDSPSGAETFTLSDRVLELIEPWLPTGAGGVYELHTGRSPTIWPEDWWQRDLDNWLAAYDEGKVS